MSYDFVIIGTGPAGSTLSWKLAKKGFKVAIIDRAIYEKQRLVNDFYCPYINKLPKYYTPVYSDQLGGNSALWHGKIYLISEKEFTENKWGFEYKELQLFSDSLANELNIDSNMLTKVLNDGKNIFHYSYRSDLKNIFKYLDITKFENIDIYKGYSPVKLNFDGGKVNSIDILNNQKNEKNIIIKNSIIFCAGGLGNPHLLLNLLPKKSENIGKFLSDHAHINLCKVKENQIKDYLNILKPNIKNNLKVPNINIKEEVAHVYEFENFFAGIQLDYKIDPMRKLRRYFLRISNLYVRKILNFFGFFILKFNGLIAKIGILFNKYYKYSFEFYFSQHQDPRNFVQLDIDSYDDFGLKKININWDLKSNDKVKIENIIKNTVGPNGNLFKSKKKINFEKNFYNYGLAGLHPSCTTKIGKNKTEGAVDQNLKLFDYKNIFVCGSSILPENGFTNPTWTIMSLANRLSAYLEKLK